jgi:hypothetical protein
MAEATVRLRGFHGSGKLMIRSLPALLKCREPKATRGSPPRASASSICSLTIAKLRRIVGQGRVSPDRLRLKSVGSIFDCRSRAIGTTVSVLPSFSGLTSRSASDFTGLVLRATARSCERIGACRKSGRARAKWHHPAAHRQSSAPLAAYPNCNPRNDGTCFGRSHGRDCYMLRMPPRC